MKQIRLIWTALLLLPATGHAALVIATNYDESSSRQLPITTAAGVAIQQGGIVQVGAFSSDVAALIGALPSTAGRDALLSNFLPFTATTSIGLNFTGLFSVETMEPLTSDSPLIGKQVYTLIGDASTFATSTQLALVSHPAVFGPDEPFFFWLADISGPYAAVLLGTSGPPATTLIGFSPTSLSLASAIPEPTSGTLLLLAITMILRRRQSDSALI